MRTLKQRRTSKINKGVSFLPMSNNILHLWRYGPSWCNLLLVESCSNRQTYTYTYNCLFSLGVAGGALYSVKGGGTNYQCLPRDPQWGQHTEGPTSGAYIHGAEYEMSPANSSPFLKVNIVANVIRNMWMLASAQAHCSWKVSCGQCVFTQVRH